MTPRRVLVVDDDPTLLAVIEMRVEAMGFEVTATHDARAALRALEDRRFDVALFDLRMEPMDGIALTHAAHERQALARMSHPCIAQVYEAGDTESGQPYFAMEHVPGEPITEYCDRERLSIDARLDLFVEVCRGVHHASAWSTSRRGAAVSVLDHCGRSRNWSASPHRDSAH